jgi:hypothetical protein
MCPLLPPSSLLCVAGGFSDARERAGDLNRNAKSNAGLDVGLRHPERQRTPECPEKRLGIVLKSVNSP